MAVLSEGMWSHRFKRERDERAREYGGREYRASTRRGLPPL